MTDQEMLDALRALRDEPQPFASVREAVLVEVKERRRREHIAGWMCALAAAAAIVLVLWTRPARRLEPLQTPARASIRPPDGALAIYRRKQVELHQSARPRWAAAVKTHVKTETLTVKMFTPDPDVVIYWIVEGQGG